MFIQFSFRLYSKQYSQFAPFSFTCNHSEGATCLTQTAVQTAADQLTLSDTSILLISKLSKLADQQHNRVAFTRSESRILSIEC
jgi:hypothetical protein